MSALVASVVDQLQHMLADATPFTVSERVGQLLAPFPNVPPETLSLATGDSGAVSALCSSLLLAVDSCAVRRSGVASAVPCSSGIETAVLDCW